MSVHRKALRRLQVSAEIFLSRPTDDVAFARDVEKTAREALALPVGEGEALLVADLLRDSEREVATLRAALRELAGAAVTDCDGAGRPFEPGEFHEHVEAVAVEALGAFMDAEPGDFNGEPVFTFPAQSRNGEHFAAAIVALFGPSGGEPEAPAHDDMQTDSRYCAECDGPCDGDYSRG